MFCSLVWVTCLEKWVLLLCWIQNLLPSTLHPSLPIPTQNGCFLPMKVRNFEKIFSLAVDFSMKRNGVRTYHKHCLHYEPVAVAERTACPLTTRAVFRLNSGNLPLLQMWHVGNVTSRHAVYMLIQCTPLLVEKAGVAPVVTFRIAAHKQERVQARYPLWLWNPWGRTHEVQNRSNQWLHKMDLGPDKNLKKNNKKTLSSFIHWKCDKNIVFSTFFVCLKHWMSSMSSFKYSTN